MWRCMEGTHVERCMEEKHVARDMDLTDDSTPGGKEG